MTLPHVAVGDPHTPAHNAERDAINALQDLTNPEFVTNLHEEFPTVTVPDATTAVKGIVELATNAETTTGTDTVRAVTPAGLKTVIDALPGGTVPDASDTVKGIVELATNAETTTGTDTVRAVTPAGLKAVTDALPVVPTATATVKGIIEIATSAETTGGVDTTRAVVPSGLKAVTDAIATANAAAYAKTNYGGDETSLAFNALTGAVTINAALASVHYNAASLTGAIILTLSNITAAGKSRLLTVTVKQDATVRAITFAGATLEWMTAIPTPVANKRIVYNFQGLGDGATVLAWGQVQP